MTQVWKDLNSRNLSTIFCSCSMCSMTSWRVQNLQPPWVVRVKISASSLVRCYALKYLLVQSWKCVSDIWCVGWNRSKKVALHVHMICCAYYTEIWAQSIESLATKLVVVQTNLISLFWIVCCIPNWSHKWILSLFLMHRTLHIES